MEDIQRMLNLYLKNMHTYMYNCEINNFLHAVRVFFFVTYVIHNLVVDIFQIHVHHFTNTASMVVLVESCTDFNDEKYLSHVAAGW